MAGFNLPPGCNVTDLPGNRPEEQAAEAFWDLAYEQFPESMPDEDKNKVINWCWEQVGNAYGEGYQQAMSDSALALEMLTADLQIVAGIKKHQHKRNVP